MKKTHNRVVYIGFEVYFRNTKISPDIPFSGADARIFLPVKLTPSSEFQKWKFHTESASIYDTDYKFNYNDKELRIFVTHTVTRYVWQFFDEEAYKKFIEKLSELTEDEKAFLVNVIHKRVNFIINYKPSVKELMQLEGCRKIKVDGFTIKLIEYDFTEVIEKLAKYYKKYPEYTKLVLTKTLSISKLFDDNEPIDVSLKKYIWSCDPLYPQTPKYLYSALYNIVNAIEAYIEFEKSSMEGNN